MNNQSSWFNCGRASGSFLLLAVLTACPPGDGGGTSVTEASTQTGGSDGTSTGTPATDGSTATQASTSSGTEAATETEGATVSGSGDAATDSGSEGGDACGECGSDGCLVVSRLDADCIAAGTHCIPPASEDCETCMQGACSEWVDMPCGEGYDCVDFAATIGGCGDALPYAEAYECMAANCEAACTPGVGFTACECA